MKICKSNSYYELIVCYEYNETKENRIYEFSDIDNCIKFLNNEVSTDINGKKRIQDKYEFPLGLSHKTDYNLDFEFYVTSRNRSNKWSIEN